MTATVNTNFRIHGWDETPYDETEDGPNLSRASVKRTFAGDLQAESTTEYLIMHRQNGSAQFVGFERVDGSLLGRLGSFILEHRGVFEGGTATTHWSVLAGSGTGDLHGIRGEGTYSVDHAESYAVKLTFDLK